jgi:hypothetical protein
VIFSGNDTLVYFTNKTYCQIIAEIMCKIEMIDRLYVILHSNMMSFFRFANKRAIYLDGKISLAHARCTHLSQVIKSQNTIIYTVVKVVPYTTGR